jgi:hypothetical protein
MLVDIPVTAITIYFYTNIGVDRLLVRSLDAMPGWLSFIIGCKAAELMGDPQVPEGRCNISVMQAISVPCSSARITNMFLVEISRRTRPFASITVPSICRGKQGNSQNDLLGFSSDKLLVTHGSYFVPTIVDIVSFSSGIDPLIG